jgi:RNA polymerase sigma-70 factor (ECF subfamily)
MEECMNATTEMEISRNIQILKRKKTEAICQELEITTSNYWQIVHRSKLLFKKMELKWV